jgi:hypothetical protein
MKPAIAYQVFPAPHPLTNALGEFLRTEQGNDFERITALFPPDWKIYVIGGLLRDFLLNCIGGMDLKPADMDIVVEGASTAKEVRERLGAAYISPNTFGGAKCRLRKGGLIFDVWRIEDHTNMAKAAKPHTVEQLLRHNLLDIDAVVWSPNIDCLHDCGCLAAIQAGRIDLMGPAGISRNFLAAQTAHVLVVIFKTGFQISEQVRAFIADPYDHGERAEVLKVLRRKLPHAVEQIEAVWESLVEGGTQYVRVSGEPRFHGENERRKVSPRRI